jgi:acyl carrier protein
MSAADAEARIEAFVRAQFAISPTDPSFERSADLFEGGYIDSVGIVELLDFLGEEFGVELPESDLLSDDFSTVEGLAAIVRRLGPVA